MFLTVLILILLSIFIAYVFAALVSLRRKGGNSFVVRRAKLTIAGFMVLLIVMYALTIAIMLVTAIGSFVVFAAVIGAVTSLIFLIAITASLMSLAGNFEKNAVFTHENCGYIKSIASSFMCIALLQIIEGIILSVMQFISIGKFGVAFSSFTAICLVFALIMQVFGVFMDRAIPEHEENELTI